MQTIIAGRFEQQEACAHALEELVRAGFAREHISSFYLNPPGRHDTFPIGGDEAESEGAKGAGSGMAAGAVTGGTVGAAVGAITAPFTGPLGAVLGGMVGAHIGNTAGAMNAMRDDTDRGEDPPARHSGMILAVGVEDEQQEEQAQTLLRSLGAGDIERASGTIEDGDWQDFNPVSAPHFIEQSGSSPY